MTTLTKRNESARMVAAAGFMLKQENMNATETITLAFTARNKCEKTNRSSPSPAGNTLNASPGANANIPFHENNTRANPNAVKPRASASTTEKIIPALHLTNNNRNREMGRDKIIRSVPS